MENPFSPSPSLTPERGVYGDARRVRARFLFRVIDFRSPWSTRMVYSGWWFRQKIELDGQLVWFRISWLTILRNAEFTIPASVDPNQPPARLEIEFGRTLSIRRFRIWIDDQIVYDEIN